MPTRRQLLRAGAAAVGGAGVAAVGLRSGGGAAAEATTTLAVAGDSTTLGPDGAVTAVTLSLDVEWAYDLPDSASPEQAIVEVAAAESGGDLQVVATERSAQLFPEAEGAESVAVGLLEEGVLDADALAPDAGGTRETDVEVEARLRVESGDGEVLARASSADTAVVTVERDSVAASEYGEVGGSGSLTVSGE